MKVNIIFSSEVTVEGKDMKEIVSKFNNLSLHPAFTGIEFREVTCVENDDTCEDLTHEFHLVQK